MCHHFLPTDTPTPFLVNLTSIHSEILMRRLIRLLKLIWTTQLALSRIESSLCRRRRYRASTRPDMVSSKSTLTPASGMPTTRDALSASNCIDTHSKYVYASSAFQHAGTNTDSTVFDTFSASIQTNPRTAPCVAHHGSLLPAPL